MDLRKMCEVVARSFRIGLASVRANAVPMAVLWCLASLLALSYYFVPGVEGLLEPVRVWQERTGWPAAFANCAFFCGALPYVVYRLRHTDGPGRPLRIALLQTVWTGFHGTLCNWFFGVQTAWFGSGTDFGTLLAKTAADQFGWTVLFIAPTNAVFYAALAGDVRSFRKGYLPNLIMNWIIWMPTTFAVYAFPQALQIQVLGFISAAWAVVCREIGVRSK